MYGHEYPTGLIYFQPSSVKCVFRRPIIHLFKVLRELIRLHDSFRAEDVLRRRRRFRCNKTEVIKIAKNCLMRSY